MLEKLVTLIAQSTNGYDEWTLPIAHNLIRNGVVALPYKPEKVIAEEKIVDNENEVAFEFYCPFCKNDVSAMYDDRLPRIFTCKCGAYLDSTDVISKAQADVLYGNNQVTNFKKNQENDYCRAGKSSL